MLKFKYLRAALVAAAFAALAFSGGARPHLVRGDLKEASVANADAAESVSRSPDTVSAGSTFYRVRNDLRRCALPLCGGYFVSRVNASSTRCADGSFKRECYVAEIDWNGQEEPEPARLLLRGSIVAKRYERFGNLGELRVSELWKSLGTNEPAGTFYRVRDRGVRCIAFPCPTHHEAKLNSSFSRNIARVNLEAVGLGDNASVVNAAMTGPEGVIVTGQDVPVKGPGGRSFELKATQVYVRNKSESASMKPCIKTGCSSQVCADQNVITTCEFRPEYECYQKATCERQSDGNCGFTKTPELTACLGRR